MVVRPYQPDDRPGVRVIYGEDETCRPALMRKYPRMSAFLADSMSYYTDYEPESALVAVAQGQVVGALLGAVDTVRCEEVTSRRVRPRVMWRCLTGAYGWPGWLPAIIRTERAARGTEYPKVDLARYPAHLHIGLLNDWQREGIGTRLMAHYEATLRARGVSGYHLYASDYHDKGVAFYRKLGLDVLGEFTWRLHDGVGWRTVTELVFARLLD